MLDKYNLLISFRYTMLKSYFIFYFTLNEVIYLRIWIMCDVLILFFVYPFPSPIPFLDGQSSPLRQNPRATRPLRVIAGKTDRTAKDNVETACSRGLKGSSATRVKRTRAIHSFTTGKNRRRVSEKCRRDRQTCKSNDIPSSTRL